MQFADLVWQVTVEDNARARAIVTAVLRVAILRERRAGQEVSAADVFESLSTREGAVEFLADLSEAPSVDDCLALIA